jgi:hypothetical protein
MTQPLPLSLGLGAANAGKLIGYTVLNLDRSVYAAFALATESAVAGTYYALGGYSAPDAGGYLVVSESDGGDPAVLTALAEVDIDPKVLADNAINSGSLGSDAVAEIASAIRVGSAGSPTINVRSHSPARRPG